VIVNVTLDDETHALIKKLAQTERRSVTNFITQYLRTSLHSNVDRQALARQMNPSFNFEAAGKERDRLQELLQSS
jgi:hypothetical protein